MLREPPQAVHAPLDRDLFCATCGYNLRGLPGDPVRCPECGFHNAVQLMEIPAAEIAGQFRRMKSVLAYSLAVLPIIVGAALLFELAVRRSDLGGVFYYFYLPLPASLLLFVFGFWRARASCRRQPGWLAALLAYYLFGALMMGGAVAMLWLAGYCSLALLPPVIYACAYSIVAELLVLLFPVRWWVLWTYRLATRRLHTLQRAVAVAIAQERLRRSASRDYNADNTTSAKPPIGPGGSNFE